MKIGIKCLALFLALAVILTLAPLIIVANDSYEDVPPNHWAYNAVTKWSGDGYGVMQGNGNGSFLPNQGLTLGELATILAKSFGYTERAEAEVTPDWSAEYVQKAIAAGVIDKEDRIDASVIVTREQAIRYIALAYNIVPVIGETTFADNGLISPEYVPYVNAFQRLGYVIGNNADPAISEFMPKKEYTRAEAMQVIENTTGDILDNSVEGANYSKNVIIRSPGISVMNTSISGNLIIGQGVGEGDVQINNAFVNGDMLVFGGGKSTLYLANFRVEGSFIVRKYDGAVRIVISGESSFEAILLETGAILVTQELADGVRINAVIPSRFLDGSKFEFVGNFDRIVNNRVGADIRITGNVNLLTLNESATVSGTGRIATAEISPEAAKGTTFETKPINIVGDGKGVVPEQPGSPSGGGGGGGGGGGTTPSRTVVSVAPLAASVAHGGSYTLPARVAALLSDGTTRDFSVTWSPSSASTASVGEFTFTGTLTMTSGFVNPNDIIKAVLKLTVTPVLRSIEVSPPAKVLYTEGEELNLAGMVVTGIFSDGSETEMPSAAYTVTGYNKAALGAQTITVKVGDEQDTFSVTVLPTVADGKLISIPEPGSVTVANGAAKTASGLKLPPQVKIEVDVAGGAVITLANVTWDVAGANYDATVKTAQVFTVIGDVTLPTGVDDDGISLETEIEVTVSAAVYSVTFNLNGQPSVAIPVQSRIAHGGKATEPTAPTSESHNFGGWFNNAACTGTAWDFAVNTVTANTTLYAKWTIKTYTITFTQKIPASPVSANLPGNLTVNHGAAAAKPSDPTLVGHIFSGWFIDEACTVAYNWATAVIANRALYAKFADALTAAADALTFALIRGSATNNPNEQSITANLTLITSMAGHPGVGISWASSAPAAIATNGTVNRPASGAGDTAVTLTATITLSGANATKTFNLIVRQRGAGSVVVTDRDTRFAPGYPVLSFDRDGKATLSLRLNPGVATASNPVIAYYAMDDMNSGDHWVFNKEGILYGHLVSKTGNDTAMASGPFNELVITGDGLYTYTTPYPLFWGDNSVSVGVVLLAGDNLDDALATGTVIALTAEQAGQVDTSPPNSQAGVFNREGNRIYAYFNKRIINNTLNFNDFKLSGAGSVNITSITVAHSASTGGYSPYPSWAVITLSGAVPVSSQMDVTLIYTKGATNIIQDANSNTANRIVWGEDPSDPYAWNPIMVPGAQSIESFINPSEGTLRVVFHPAIWPEGSQNYNVVTLKKGSTVVARTFQGSSYRDDGFSSECNFTFAKDTSGGGGYTVEVAAGLTAFANSPFGQIAAQNVNKTMPQVTTAGVSASLSGNQIILNFPSGLEFSHGNWLACSFILMVDGKRVLIRDDCSSWGLALNARRRELVAAGTTVTIAYDPNAGGHTKEIYGWMTDLSGAYIPAFGPVAVTK